MKKVSIPSIVGIISIAFIAWILFSWLNVISHNLHPNPVYADWNFFAIFFR